MATPLEISHSFHPTTLRPPQVESAPITAGVIYLQGEIPGCSEKTSSGATDELICCIKLFPHKDKVASSVQCQHEPFRHQITKGSSYLLSYLNSNRVI